MNKVAELSAEVERLKSEYLTLWDDFCSMRDRNVGLQKSVDELQRWRDAVPIQAIRDVNGSHVPIDDVIAGVDTVDAWLASLARPEVQP